MMTANLLSRVLAMLLAFLIVVAQAQDLNGLREHGQVKDRAELEKIIAREPPSGMTHLQAEVFYRAQLAAAAALGDGPLSERILRRWLKDSPEAWSPRALLFGHLVRTDRAIDGLALGESLLKSSEWSPNLKARIAMYLSRSHLETGNLARSEQLLSVAEKLIASNFNNEDIRFENRAFLTQFATQQFFLAQCEFLIRMYRIDKAIEQCRLADDAGRQVVALLGSVPVVPESTRLEAVGGHVVSVIALAKALILATRRFDADATLGRAMTLTKSYGLTRSHILNLYDVSTDALIARHEYAAAERLASAGLQEAQVLNAAPTDRYPTALRGHLLRSLVGQARWGEAQAGFEALDRDTGPNAVAQKRALNLDARAITAIMVGQSQRVMPHLLRALETNETDYGPEHLITGFTRGLYGMSLAASAEAGDRDRALPELARAVASITSPSPLGEDYSDVGLRRVYRRMILEKYLELATRQAPDPQTTVTTFRVADFLRGSSVQRALSEAAARSAASSVGLAGVVRRDQDAANEQRALYGFIAAQLGAEQAGKDERVVAQMKTRIAELEKIRSALKTEIAKQFPDYDRLVNPQPPKPDDIAQRLGEGEVFVSLLPTQNYVYVWAIGKSGTAFHRAALDETRLKDLVRRVRLTLDVAEAGGAAPRFDAQASAELFEALLKPGAASLQGAKSLVLAPGGLLGQIPMGVLLTETWTGSDPALAPWLIKQVAVSHVASASAWMSLKTLADAKPAQEALAAWGDPLFDTAAPQRTTLPTRTVALTRTVAPGDIEEAPRPALEYGRIPALPETRQEIEAIAASLGATTANDAFFGDRATRESVLASNKSGLLARKRVVVFATHGLVSGDLPNLTQPALALAATGQEKANPLAALLTLEDVLALKLNADWVVLSACNTAAADGGAEEALSGLARGFFYAGSRSVLVTHWAVESESAKELTTNTFAHYAANPRAAKAESLRQAMLKVMAMPQYSHPAYWAPYALAGDGGR